MQTHIICGLGQSNFILRRRLTRQTPIPPSRIAAGAGIEGGGGGGGGIRTNWSCANRSKQANVNVKFITATELPL